MSAADEHSNDPSKIENLGHLELAAKSIVKGFIRGLHRSATKGSSTEFAEHRSYSPGDDLRRLDWRAYARSNRYLLRQYEDETNLRGIVAVDYSASMAYAGSGISKISYARHLSAALAHILLSQRDAVGFAALGSALNEFIPPRATADHLTAIIERSASTETQGETRLHDSMSRLADRIPSRAMVLLFSDLLDDAEDILKGLARLREKGCEIIVFHIMDRDELDPPFDGWTVLTDPENPNLELRLDVRQAREIYRTELAAHRETLRRGCSAAGVDLIPCITDQAFEVVLADYIASRSGARRWGR